MLSGQYLFRMNDKTTHKHTDNNRTRKPDFSPLLTQDVECTLRRRLGALFRGVPGAGARQEEVPREVRMSQQPRVRKRKAAAARHQQRRQRDRRGEEDAGSEEEEEDVGSEEEEENHDPRGSPPHKRHEADRIREQFRGKQLPDANRRWVVLPSWSKDALEEGNRDVLAANERAQAMTEQRWRPGLAITVEVSAWLAPQSSSAAATSLPLTLTSSRRRTAHRQGCRRSLLRAGLAPWASSFLSRSLSCLVVQGAPVPPFPFSTSPSCLACPPTTQPGNSPRRRLLLHVERPALSALSPSFPTRSTQVHNTAHVHLYRTRKVGISKKNNERKWIFFLDQRRAKEFRSGSVLKSI